jgi:regulator of cell morphogenesis and NO signaling
MTITPPVIDPTRTLASLVAELSERAVMLDRLGLDYCCHGQRSLADACADAGLDVTAAAYEIGSVAGGTTVQPPSEPGALADYIEATHHAYLHTELPELAVLAAKVTTVHGARHPELSAVNVLVTALRIDLEPHLAKEERVLFPAIRALTLGERGFPFKTVRNPVRMMTAEHDRAGALLAELRTVTCAYSPPSHACASYRSLYERLEHLERDTHRHIHLENNVLFPAALALESVEP